MSYETFLWKKKPTNFPRIWPFSGTGNRYFFRSKTRIPKITQTVGERINFIHLALDHWLKDTPPDQTLMLYSEESDWWIPESKEFCLMCLRVAGGDSRLHEQGKDSGPLPLDTDDMDALFACEPPPPPTNTRCHKLLEVWGRWKPRVSVAEDEADGDTSAREFFFFCRSADCDLCWTNGPLPAMLLRLTKSSATRFSWIRSKVLKGKYFLQCLHSWRGKFS